MEQGSFMEKIKINQYFRYIYLIPKKLATSTAKADDGYIHAISYIKKKEESDAQPNLKVFIKDITFFKILSRSE